MRAAVGVHNEADAALQEYLVGALCRGVAARDPAWVIVLATVVSGAPRAIQQQLAAQPGLLKGLAGYLAHSQLSNSSAAGPPAAGFSVAASDATCSSGKQQQGGSSRRGTNITPSSSREQLEAAAGVLAHLLISCGPCAPPPSYQDLAPALQAAIQQCIRTAPVLVQAVLQHSCSDMVLDQQLLGIVLEAAEQGQEPAAAVLAALAPKVLQLLEDPHPVRTGVSDRVTALLAGGTASGGAFLAAAVQQEGGTMWEVPGMVEAACSGLLAACRMAAAVDASPSSSDDSSSGFRSRGSPCLGDLPPAHTACVQYLRGLVGVVLHLATHTDPGVVSARLAELAGCLVPGVARALTLLLHTLQLPGSISGDRHPVYHHPQRCYYDNAWAALLALSECPGAAALVAALFQHQPRLLEGLADSWQELLANDEYQEQPARLATCLLLSGSIPGQEERRQCRRLLAAAFQLWDWNWPDHWQGRGGVLMEILQASKGPMAVVFARQTLRGIFAEGLLPHEHKVEGWARLLAAPVLATELVAGLWDQQDKVDDIWAVDIVDAVWKEDVLAHTQALLAIAGLGDALAANCHFEWGRDAVDSILPDALGSEVLQAYLGQQPDLLRALLQRLVEHKQRHTHKFWRCLAGDDSGDEWVLQQPVVLDGVIDALVEIDTSDTYAVVAQLLGVAHTLVCESLLRRPGALDYLLQMLVQRHWQRPPASDDPTGDTQLLLLKGLAKSELAPRALALLPGLLAEGDEELSAGVFEAMRLIQRRMRQGGLPWGEELAATSSRGAPVLCAEEQLQSLRQGVEQVQRATAAAAAATQQLRERSIGQPNKLLGSGLAPQGVCSSSKHSGPPGQRAPAVGGWCSTGERLVPAASVEAATATAAAAAAVPHGSEALEAASPAGPGCKRTRR